MRLPKSFFTPRTPALSRFAQVLKTSSTRRLAAAAVVGCSALFVSGPGHASNATPIELDLTYDFYLGGLPVAEAKLKAEIDGNAYSAASKLRTVGIVGMFFDTEVNTSADGNRDGETDFLPTMFEMKSRTKRKRQDLTMAFDATTAPSDVSAQPPFRKKAYELDPAQQAGTLDPMSAVVATFLPETVDNICNRTLEIFDGRRRYDVIFDSVRNDYLDDGERLIECTGVYKRVAGYKPKTMRKQTEFDFYIRFAVREDGSARAVRVWGDTDFGTAVAVVRR